MTKPDEVASFSQFSVVAKNTLVGSVGPFLNTITLLLGAIVLIGMKYEL